MLAAERSGTGGEGVCAVDGQRVFTASTGDSFVSAFVVFSVPEVEKSSGLARLW